MIGEPVRKLLGWTLFVPGMVAYLYGLGCGIWWMIQRLLDFQWQSAATVFLIGILAAFIGFALLSWDNL